MSVKCRSRMGCSSYLTPNRPLTLHLMMDQLNAIAALPDQKIKAEQYRAVLQTVLAQQQAAECKAFVDHCES